MKNIAVLIDLWTLADGSLDLLTKATHKKWITDVESKDIDTVIVATYDVCDKEWTHPIAQTTKQFVGENNWNNKVKNIQYDQVFNHREDHITNPEVWRLTQTKNLYTIHYPWEFPNIDEIQSVYMYGAAWDICVRHRPLGFDFWLQKTKSKILLPKNSCKFSNQTYVDFDAIPTVQKVQDNLYQMERM